MLLSLLGSSVVFAVVSIGLGWPVAARLPLTPSERITVSVLISLIATFAVGWMVYAYALPTGTLFALPAVALLNVALSHRSLLATLRDGEAGNVLVFQVIVSAWCIGWLALIQDYSGGRLAADWFGHWQRALFFLYQWPHDILFNGFDPLPSRPPLANVVNGALLRVTRVDFAHYQLFSTLLSSLTFLPAALIARRLGSASAAKSALASRRVTAVLAVLFMLSPLFVQNATYAWTKLPVAFFVLGSVYFFLRAQDVEAPRAAAPLFAASLAAALLTHYSAGPYAMLLALGWFWLGWPARHMPVWRRSTIHAGITGAALLATWFGWATIVYGSGAWLSNTTVSDQASSFSAQLGRIALNIRDSVVPPFLRDTGADFFAQSSPWGGWRDWFFQLHQNNLLFVFGSLSGVVLIHVALIDWRRHPRSRLRTFWPWFILAVTIVGLAVHGGRETGGLADICLQPLVLLGLSYLAARWYMLSQFWQRVVVAGATIDIMLGIVLQAGVQHHFFDRWLTPERDWAATVASYSPTAQLNLRVKADAGWVFVGDHAADLAGWIAGGLAGLLAVALFVIPKLKRFPAEIKPEL